MGQSVSIFPLAPTPTIVSRALHMARHRRHMQDEQMFLWSATNLLVNGRYTAPPCVCNVGQP